MITTLGELTVETRDDQPCDAICVTELLGVPGRDRVDHYRLGSRRFATCIDVGANIGLFVLAVTSSNPGLVVEAYEPEPDNFRVLCSNLEHNGLTDRVRPVNAAVWSEETTVTISPRQGLTHVCGRGSCGHTQWGCGGDQVNVPAVLLDSIMLGPVDLLKVDVEGAEFEILPAADLSRFGMIVLEVHDYYGAERRGALWDLLNETHVMVQHVFALGSGGIWTGDRRA